MSEIAIEETILVGAPPEAVWKLLVDLHTWTHWWPGCLQAETNDRKILRDGSAFRMTIQLGLLKFKFKPKVDAATAPKTLVWTGTGGGVTGRHAFYLEPRPDGTFVRQQERFTGPGVLLFRLLRLNVATRKMFHANLRGLKRFAERAI